MFHEFKPGRHLWILAGLAWGFIVLQHILYTLRALPVRFCKTEYHCGSEQGGYTVWMCCERLWHADALKAMASLNRMVAVQYGQRQTSMHRAKFKLQEAKPERKVENFFHILKMDMRVTLWDTVFVNLLQACSKLMFQTTLWSLLRFIDPDVSLTSPVVLKTLIPLCLTHLTSFMSFSTSLSDWLEVRETRVKVRKELGMEMRQACFREYDKLAVFERLVGAVLTLQILFQLLCVFKFYKSFQCEHALWNISGGCVEIQSSG